MNILGNSAFFPTQTCSDKRVEPSCDGTTGSLVLLWLCWVLSCDSTSGSAAKGCMWRPPLGRRDCAWKQQHQPLLRAFTWHLSKDSGFSTTGHCSSHPPRFLKGGGLRGPVCRLRAGAPREAPSEISGGQVGWPVADAGWCSRPHAAPPEGSADRRGEWMAELPPHSVLCFRASSSKPV